MIDAERIEVGEDLPLKGDLKSKLCNQRMGVGSTWDELKFKCVYQHINTSPLCTPHIA